MLVFYPFDFHPACTSQWLTLIDDTVVLGAGADGVYSHREYADASDIGVTLLADTNGAVAEAYDVLTEEFEGHRRAPDRVIFVVGTDETVRYARRASRLSDQPELQADRAALDTTAPDPLDT